MSDDSRDSRPPASIPVPSFRRPELGPVGARPSVAPPGLSLPNLPRDDASTMDLAQLTSRASAPLSPELEELLELARDRVGAEEEVDREEVLEEIEDVLPSEILASLDEPEPAPMDEESSFFPSAHPGQARGRTPSEISGTAPTTGSGRPVTGAREQTGSRAKSDAGPRTDAGSEPPRMPRPSELAPPRAPSAASFAPTTPPVAAAPVASEPPAGSSTDKPPTMRAPTPELAFERRFSQLAPPMPANEATAPPKLGVPRATLALAIVEQASGQVSVESGEGLRYVVLETGDVVTAASDIPGEDLLGFLSSTGVMAKAVEERLRGRIPAFGKRAGAALVAHGELSQDELWSVLRGYAEWVLAAIVRLENAAIRVGEMPVARLAGEPSAFGGSAGAQVFVDIVRRTVSASSALGQLGTPASRLAMGERAALLRECGLTEEDEALVREAEGRTIGDVLGRRDFEFSSVLLALVDLGICRVEVASVSAFPGGGVAPRGSAPPLAASVAADNDEALVRARIAARLALVEEGDYFAVLGVSPDATGYEIRRAFLDLRRTFDPHRLLSPALFDLAGDLKTIVVVLEEAYEILRDPVRRDRYKTALFARGPG